MNGKRFGCASMTSVVKATSNSVPKTKNPAISMAGTFERMISVTELLAFSVAYWMAKKDATTLEVKNRADTAKAR